MEEISKNFIEAFIDEDIAAGGQFEGKRRVVTVLYPYNEGECKVISAKAGNGFDDTDIVITTADGDIVLDEKDFV